ncbi:PepSY-like domain-containing protein [Deminuibacter soli]|uniref:Putative beta-lactamase-inhibitor-like PepSY-like domain-containing protein n=1 Tax=Deminuibacter soli TaxID=2291815 RepID=A0A3E1NEL7_9BACT|nr:PepSY-like domain-containing protein [Deminuibacter soli]RFM26425.1 hypothetical protein DXN05_19540 [Deminuibacter soli]
MKPLMLVLVSGLFITTLSAQKKEATPVAAQAAFQKAYPGATKVKWGREDADYEVNFTAGGKELSAVYDASGTLKETEEDIRTAELPAPVAAYIKQHYKGASIKEAAKITRAGGEVNYEAEVNKTDLIFDKEGNFIKAVKD